MKLFWDRIPPLHCTVNDLLNTESAKSLVMTLFFASFDAATHLIRWLQRGWIPKHLFMFAHILSVRITCAVHDQLARYPAITSREPTNLSKRKEESHF